VSFVLFGGQRSDSVIAFVFRSIGWIMTMVCSTAANLVVGATLIYLSIICFVIYLLGWQKNRKELNKG
jgi:hypothetical protein